MDTTEKAIEICDLVYYYKSDWTTKRFHALKGICLDVLQGESFGFLGHNGAGKTTTIKCILQLIKPSAGVIRIYGRDSSESRARQSVGYLPEQPYFYDHLTVYELVSMYAHLAGLATSEIPTAVNQSLDRVRVSAKRKSPMRTLSKGLTQRVAMAQAIVANPRLLILDEPFSGLDPIGRKEFKDLLFDLKESGTTIFVSSHILGDIEFLCDRASIMAHGELKEVFHLRDLPKFSTPSYELVVTNAESLQSELLQGAEQHEAHGQVLRIRYHEKELAEKALSRALDSNVEIENYQVIQGSLEDLFIKLVEFDESNAGLKGRSQK